jgi:hypothetical protein
MNGVRKRQLTFYVQSMAQVNATWNTEEVEGNLKRLGDEMTRKAKEACWEAVKVIWRESEKQCPYDTGNLKDSWDSEDLQSEIGYKVGYGMKYRVPYARRLHEHPEYKFQRGRKAKYLSDPIDQNTGDWKGAVTNKLKEALR